MINQTKFSVGLEHDEAVLQTSQMQTNINKIGKPFSLNQERHLSDSEGASTFTMPSNNYLTDVSHYITPEVSNSLYNERHQDVALAPAAAFKGVFWPEERAKPASNAAIAAKTGSSESDEPVTLDIQLSELTSDVPENEEPGDLGTEINSSGTDCGSSGDSQVQTLAAAPAAVLPRLAGTTRIHAQVFRRSSNPNDKRRGFRNVKLYAWTTKDLDLINDQAHMAAKVVFNLVSPDIFIKAVQKNKRNGTIGPRLASNLEAIGKELKEDNKLIGSPNHEQASVAYLKVKGLQSGVSGTEIIAHQVCILRWNRQEDGTYAPSVTLIQLAPLECVEIDCFLLSKNKFNKLAAEFAGYYDPLDYNAYRKKKR